MGAGLAVSEMVTSKAGLWHSKKTQSRINHEGEASPVSIQVVGTDPEQIALAAQFNAIHGADIIDINMGCPAKKVCNVQAGSALLKDEKRVAAILNRVVNSISLPVTLKIRTGWDIDNRNALSIARIAEESGIQALTIHGRTRACGYNSKAEYDTIASVKQRVNIPVIANGDINSAETTRSVLQYTGADAVMIGRAAKNNPWLFADINHFLNTGRHLLPPTLQEKSEVLLRLLKSLYIFYGDQHGVKIARKHLAWTVLSLPDGEQFWQQVNNIPDAKQQLSMTQEFFSRCIERKNAA
jgi:tRNA-dihydrouridine synthase B